ncbi:AAA family ATPase [Edaphocola flava]|jgi:MoxR-like ATPase|uniref:AAA family ATPase n=1 Tax=Edaphocola flava TaxID=2499629 RepID=UPI00100AA104|nr:MoxR family ATPase [Edaphocola flava]
MEATVAAQGKIGQLITEMETVIRGKRQQVEQVITCLLAKGHILMEDNPGTGKTVLARTLAHAISGSGAGNAVFKRIQFTPDLLPMDLIGAYIFDDQRKDFIFKRGPLFCNILLADEINRASPKVQSALLESMAEGQITIGEQTVKLQQPFFTIATQNPVETEGTYPLPTAQLDRFFMKIYFGYVDEKTELEIYQQYLQINDNLNQLKQILSLQDILDLQQAAEQVYIHPEIVQSVANLVRATRNHPDISLGASTRSGITFIKCLKAFALVKGRDFVIEDDVQYIANPVLAHRLIFRSKEARTRVLEELIAAEMQRLQALKLY